MEGRHRVFDFNQAQDHLCRPKLVLAQAGLLIGSKYGRTTLAEPFLERLALGLLRGALAWQFRRMRI